MSYSNMDDRAANAFKHAPMQVRELVVETLEASQNKHNVTYVALLRAMRALSRLMKNNLHVTEAAAQSSDLQVLISILQEPEVQALLAQSDSLAPAKIRGLKLQAEILDAEGGCVFSSEFAKLVGMTAAGVDKARRAGALVAFPRGQAKYAYPIWQIHEGAVLRGLKEALRLMGDESMFAKAHFFLNANSRLYGKRPLDVLRSGSIDEVLAAATAHGEHGAS